MGPAYWSAPRLFPGGTVFVLAGGPSARGLDFGRLSSFPVIAVNSAWRTFPAAPFLFFGDARWFRQFRPDRACYGGRIITTSEVSDPRVSRMRKLRDPARFADRPDALAMQWTSVTAAINLAIHFGAARIVLLGLDGRLAADGRRHNHDDRYPWPLFPDSFAKHDREFRQVAQSLPAGVTVVNANPGSATTAWPKKRFEDVMSDIERQAA